MTGAVTSEQATGPVLLRPSLLARLRRWRRPLALGMISPWTVTGTASSLAARTHWATWWKDDQSHSRRCGHKPTTCNHGRVRGHERGWEQVSERLDWAAAGIKATNRVAENVVTIVGDGLAYTVGLEHMIRLIGDQPTPRTLRCTQAYRRENGEWKVILRHADVLLLTSR